MSKVSRDVNILEMENALFIWTRAQKTFPLTHMQWTAMVLYGRTRKVLLISLLVLLESENSRTAGTGTDGRTKCIRTGLIGTLDDTTPTWSGAA